MADLGTPRTAEIPEGGFPPAIPGIAFQVGDGGREVVALTHYACVAGIPRRFFHKHSEVPDGWLPVGSVPWVSSVLGREVTPDYFPGFLRGWVRRKVWRQEKWPIGHRVHIKPADRHKRFTGFVTGGSWKGKRRGPYWCSEIVSFSNEWRYYVADGSLLAAHWYSGDPSEPPAPPMRINWPEGWCGTTDFGAVDDRVELVEAHPPMSTGWYGAASDGEAYAKWLWSGWLWLRAGRDLVVADKNPAFSTDR